MIAFIEVRRSYTPWALQGTSYAYLHDAYGQFVHGGQLLAEIAHHGGEGTAFQDGPADSYFFRWPNGLPQLVEGPLAGTGSYSALTARRATIAEQRALTGSNPPIPPAWLASAMSRKPKRTPALGARTALDPAICRGVNEILEELAGYMPELREALDRFERRNR